MISNTEAKSVKDLISSAQQFDFLLNTDKWLLSLT
jgi:hypothetical protein